MNPPRDAITKKDAKNQEKGNRDNSEQYRAVALSGARNAAHCNSSLDLAVGGSESVFPLLQEILTRGSLFDSLVSILEFSIYTYL